MPVPWNVKAIKRRYNVEYRDVINMFRAGSLEAADKLRNLLFDERRELAEHGYQYGKAGRYKRVKTVQTI